MIELVMAVFMILGAVIIGAFIIGAAMLGLVALAWIGGTALNVMGWITALSVHAYRLVTAKA